MITSQANNATAYTEIEVPPRSQPEKLLPASSPQPFHPSKLPAPFRMAFKALELHEMEEISRLWALGTSYQDELMGIYEDALEQARLIEARQVNWSGGYYAVKPTVTRFVGWFAEPPSRWRGCEFCEAWRHQFEAAQETCPTTGIRLIRFSNVPPRIPHPPLRESVPGLSEEDETWLTSSPPFLAVIKLVANVLNLPKRVLNPMESKQ